MATSDKNKKQVMDVSKPGKTPADASSRPVIVGHKPLVQDPMVTTDEVKEETTEDAPKVSSPAASKKIIAPLSEADKTADEPNSDESAEDNKPEPDQDDVKEESTADTATKDEDEKSESPETEEHPEASESSEKNSDVNDSAVVDAVIDQVGDKKQDEIAAEEERKRQETIDKLVAEKKYFVPIGKSHKKSGKVSLVITLFLLVVFIGLLLAIDAELLDAGFNLPFDLIKTP